MQLRDGSKLLKTNQVQITMIFFFKPDTKKHCAVYLTHIADKTINICNYSILYSRMIWETFDSVIYAHIYSIFEVSASF